MLPLQLPENQDDKEYEWLVDFAGGQSGATVLKHQHGWPETVIWVDMEQRKTGTNICPEAANRLIDC